MHKLPWPQEQRQSWRHSPWAPCPALTRTVTAFARAAQQPMPRGAGAKDRTCRTISDNQESPVWCAFNLKVLFFFLCRPQLSQVTGPAVLTCISYPHRDPMQRRLLPDV
jgi:hypothetical protein